jgi:hypothetical protein
VSLRIVFGDPRLGDRCNSAASIDKLWGEAAPDVKASLDLLATSPDLNSYVDLPNVTHEGARTVFRGRNADVVLELIAIKGLPPTVEVVQIDVRAKGGSA